MRLGLAYTIILGIASALLALQAPAPLPRQAAGNATLNANTIKNQGQADKNKSTSSPIQNTVATDGSEQEAQGQTPKNEYVHIVVDQIPGKDTWDKVYIWLTGALVLVAALTCGVIWYQAEVTARAADATRKSAAATEKSVKLQEAALHQWVVIDNWRIEPQPILETGAGKLGIKFDITNPTKLPLTLLGVEIYISGKGVPLGENMVLVPDHPFAYTVWFFLSSEEYNLLTNRALVIPVRSSILFEDALKSVINQPMSGLLSCSGTNCRFFPQSLEREQERE